MEVNLNDLNIFSEVVHQQNFTRTATKLGITQSAVSQSIQHLEQSIGLKLFHRTTRSLRLTQAGEQLFERIDQNIKHIQQGLEQLSLMKNQPSGHVRISADSYTIKYHLWPKLEPLIHQYPDICLALVSENRRIDIAKEGYDAGVRVGRLVEKDMVAFPISQEIEFVLLASPSYLNLHGVPKNISDLQSHRCIYIQLMTENAIMPWELNVAKKHIFFKGKAQLIMNDLEQMLDATIQGCGISYLPYDLAKQAIESGQVQRLMPEYCISLPPLYLFYTSRNLLSPAFEIVKNLLKGA
ncbi:LysR family transcriptional regulator [Acinetobacter rathckeae]|uniref:LysR family transcriptional regulator n=1 Tax=Acinetobacter rathckeae TaxID=2605272 RepID=UPI0018A32FE8|nr:LysR family transcriptional regulator [Acinetobacter rathckeae]MBF7695342.1 LysR family transcriptional regulator [Acinetobacter rathckeae]